MKNEELLLQMKYLRGSAGRFCREFGWRLCGARLVCPHPWVPSPVVTSFLAQAELAPSTLLESIAGF